MFVTVLSSYSDVNLSYTLGPCFLLVVVLVILLSWVVYVCVWFVLFAVTVVIVFIFEGGKVMFGFQMSLVFPLCWDNS